MQLPNYNWNNTVNLISSIMSYCWVTPKYPELDLLKSKNLQKYDNVVLFLIDALWYKWLETYWKDSFLYSKLAWNMTSVFPSTTSTAITTFATWYTASEHAITWWNMFLKEVGAIAQILPWKHKISWVTLGDKIDIGNLSQKTNFYWKSNKDVFIVTDNRYINSEYNKFYNKNSKVLGYNDLPNCFSQIKNALNYNNKQKYIYTYWWEFDTISHDYWIDSVELKNHFDDLDCHFKKLEEYLKQANTLLLVTADHWQINCENIIDLKDYPEIYDMLAMPLSWERRSQICFVKNWLTEKFYNQVKEKLSSYLDIFSKEEILKMKLFWNSKNKKFLDRIGDFLLLPKDGYIIQDWVNKPYVAYHWGLSDWEVLVPLIKV